MVKRIISGLFTLLLILGAVFSAPSINSLSIVNSTGGTFFAPGNFTYQVYVNSSDNASYTQNYYTIKFYVNNVSVQNTTLASQCLQDFANSSTACGNTAGSYASGSYSSYNATYFKPAGVLSTSKLQYKLAFQTTPGTVWNISTGNASIPSDCWNAFSDKIIIYGYSRASDSIATAYLQCWNGTTFKTLIQVAPVGGNNGGNGCSYSDNIGSAYDGNYSTIGYGHWVCGSYNVGIYEESMVWDGVQKFNLNTLANAGNLTFNAGINSNITAEVTACNSDTCASPQNVSILTIPGAVWLNQTPADLTSTTAFTQLFTTYWNITGGTGTPILYTLVNSSTRQNLIVINGTARNSWTSEFSTVTNVTPINSTGVTTWKGVMDDGAYLPAIYNLNETFIEAQPHTVLCTLSGVNDVCFIEMINFTNVTNNVNLELMINDTNSIARLYLCNNSFDNSSRVTTSPNCGFTNSRPAGGSGNLHNETGLSFHEVFSTPLNVTSGNIGTVHVTPKMILAVTKPDNVGTVYIWGVNTTARAGVVKFSSTGGIIETNVPGTADAHVHFTALNDIFYYKLEYTIGSYANNSTVVNDTLDLDYLKPSVPFITYPSYGSMIYENSSINFTWQASFTDSRLSITGYNVTVKNSTGSVFSVVNNTTSLNAVWNSAGYAPGNYTFRIIAYDSNGSTASGSVLFTLFHYTSGVTITAPSSGSYLLNPNGYNVFYTFSVTPDANYSCVLSRNGGHIDTQVISSGSVTYSDNQSGALNYSVTCSNAYTSSTSSTLFEAIRTSGFVACDAYGRCTQPFASGSVITLNLTSNWNITNVLTYVGSSLLVNTTAINPEGSVWQASLYGENGGTYTSRIYFTGTSLYDTYIYSVSAPEAPIIADTSAVTGQEAGSQVLLAKSLWDYSPIGSKSALDKNAIILVVAVIVGSVLLIFVLAGSFTKRR